MENDEIKEISLPENSKELEEKFIKEAQELGLNINENELNKFRQYYLMVVNKNQVMNLTAITEYEDFLTKHFLDSIAIIKVIKEELGKELSKAKIIDIGTGAGFPGLPLKIIAENNEITLLDSLNKRIKFLKDVIEELELKEITAIHGRCEESARKKEFRESFAYAVSRAVANLSTLVEYCLPFVKEGGYFISYKAGEIDKEIQEAKNAIKKLGGQLEKTVQFKLSNKDIDRSFVIIKKIKETPKAYPRQAGKPAKEPIK